MKRYKVTVTFEVNDSTGEIEQEIQEKGITHVEKVFALGFTDPELEGVTSKVEEVENA